MLLDPAGALLVPTETTLDATPYLALIVGSVAMAAVLMLPGFGLTWLSGNISRRVRRRGHGPRPQRRFDQDTQADPLVLALATSVIFISFVGAVLLSFGLFSTLGVGLVALAASVPGIPSFVAWARGLRGTRWPLGVVAGLSVPWIALAVSEGFPPAATLRWYYWELGRQLDEAGGVPSWVLEFGEHVRWLPDYVFFNVTSEAYRALAVGIDDAWAMAAWTAPIVLITLSMTYLVLRLWFSRPASVTGLAAIAGTTFFLTKFNAYKPEAIGTTLGLVGVWLVVQGLRRSRAVWIVLAGALFGVGVGVHGIAAAAIGLLAVSAGVVEWFAGKRVERIRSAVAILGAAVGAGVVVLLTGWSLQGRLLVASDAANPEQVNGADPTWTFLRRSNGIFDAQDPPPLDTRVLDAIGSPWPGVDLTALVWIGAGLVGVVGVVLLLRLGPGEAKRGAVAILAFAGLLIAGMALFAFSFRTYVPQHTGIARLGDYLGLAAGMGAAAAFQGLILAWERRAHRPAGRKLSIGVTAFMLAWTVPVALAEYSRTARFSDESLSQLATLADAASPGQAVLSNAGTRGSIEFFTGLESSLEGRQPLIEDLAFLRSTNQLLSRAHGYFSDPSDGRQLLQRLDVDWLVIASDPAALGTSVSYGGQPSEFDSLSYLTPFSRAPGLSVYRTDFSQGTENSLGAAELHPLRFIASTSILIGLFGGLLLLLRRMAPRAPATSSRPGEALSSNGKPSRRDARARV